MRNRFMRVIVFFDLPVETVEDRKAYRTFRKFLLNEGFIMLQESIYSKLALNQTSANLITAKLRKNKPPKGLVQVLKVTEKQFANIENLTGVRQPEEIDSTQRMVIL